MSSSLFLDLNTNSPNTFGQDLMTSYKKLINMRKIDDVIKSIFRSEPNVFGQDLMTSYEKLINMRMFKSVRKKSVRNQNAPETAFSHYSITTFSALKT